MVLDAGDGVIFYDYRYIPSGQEVMLAVGCIIIAAALATGNIPAGATITAGLAVAG